jgi:hypothetical protein
MNSMLHLCDVCAVKRTNVTHLDDPVMTAQLFSSLCYSLGASLEIDTKTIITLITMDIILLEAEKEQNVLDPDAI